jgi:hypothetical protein
VAVAVEVKQHLEDLVELVVEDQELVDLHTLLQ